MKKHRQSQPRIPGVRRETAHATMLKELKQMVERDARMAGVSRSWVIAVILGDHYHVQTADYRKAVRQRLSLLKAG